MEEDIVLELKLPKIPDIELVALESLERLGRYLGISQDKLGEAKVVITEALINAFEHGGEDNPVVNVEFNMSRQKLTVFVTDFGTGFNPDNIPDPNIEDKIGSNNKRGWGLKLMKSMSDDLIIESGPSGTKISIIKNLI